MREGTFGVTSKQLHYEPQNITTHTDKTDKLGQFYNASNL